MEPNNFRNTFVLLCGNTHKIEDKNPTNDPMNALPPHLHSFFSISSPSSLSLSSPLSLNNERCKGRVAEPNNFLVEIHFSIYPEYTHNPLTHLSNFVCLFIRKCHHPLIAPSARANQSSIAPQHNVHLKLDFLPPCLFNPCSILLSESFPI
jgi:hypothetical protein